MVRVSVACKIMWDSSVVVFQFSSRVREPPTSEVMLVGNRQVRVSFSSEACGRHQTEPTASAALGRAILGTLLMSCFRGEGEKTQVTFRGDGPLGMIQVISQSSGLVKGLLGNPAVNFPLRGSDGKLDVSRAVGKGVLAVVRSLPFTEEGWQTPYTGMVPITTGEIAEDLATYLADSEQVQSALGLGVSVGKDLRVDTAGGFLIQVLPFAEESTIAQLEKNIAAAGSMTKMLRDGLSPKDITNRLLEGIGSGGDGFSLIPRYVLMMAVSIYTKHIFISTQQCNGVR